MVFYVLTNCLLFTALLRKLQFPQNFHIVHFIRQPLSHILSCKMVSCCRTIADKSSPAGRIVLCCGIGMLSTQCYKSRTGKKPLPPHFSYSRIQHSSSITVCKIIIVIMIMITIRPIPITVHCLLFHSLMVE